MLCSICILQAQPRQHVLDHADYTAPTWQQEQYDTYQELTIYLR